MVGERATTAAAVATTLARRLECSCSPSTSALADPSSRNRHESLLASSGQKAVEMSSSLRNAASIPHHQLSLSLSLSPSKSKSLDSPKKQNQSRVVTGGVVSGLGKGVTASSIGVLLKACGHRVTSIKIGEAEERREKREERERDGREKEGRAVAAAAAAAAVAAAVVDKRPLKKKKNLARPLKKKTHQPAKYNRPVPQHRRRNDVPL